MKGHGSSGNVAREGVRHKPFGEFQSDGVTLNDGRGRENRKVEETNLTKKKKWGEAKGAHLNRFSGLRTIGKKKSSEKKLSYQKKKSARHGPRERKTTGPARGYDSEAQGGRTTTTKPGNGK